MISSHFRYYGNNPRIRIKTKGWGPFREDWYSICSAHQSHDDNCDLCQKGGWINTWGHFFSHIVFKLSPNLWRWWANRDNKSANKVI